MEKLLGPFLGSLVDLGITGLLAACFVYIAVEKLLAGDKFLENISSIFMMQIKSGVDNITIKISDVESKQNIIIKLAQKILENSNKSDEDIISALVELNRDMDGRAFSPTDKELILRLTAKINNGCDCCKKE